MVDPIVAPSPARVIEPAPAGLFVDPTAPRLGSIRPPIPVVYPEGHTDQLIIVEARTERRLAEVRGCTIDRPTWVLNGVGSMGFAGSTHNAAFEHLVDPSTVVDRAGVMRLVGREIQFWRDGDLHWSGPPITGTVDPAGTVSFTCMDLGWYFTRKFFGPAERRDLLLGIGSMESVGLPGWITTLCTKTRDTADKQRGAASMKLTGSEPGNVSAQFVRPVTTVAESLPVHVTAVVKIPEGTPKGTRILTIAVRSLDYQVRNLATVVVDEDTTFGEWQRVTTYALLPPGSAHIVQVLLFSVGVYGATGFDDVRVLENNTTGYPAPGRDLVIHGVAAINHAQNGEDNAPGFNINPVVRTNSGTVEPLGERHQNHIQIQDFLRRYTDRADGFDWRIIAARRQIEFAHRVGVDHRHLVLHDRTAPTGGWTHDESELSSKVVVPGEGDGVDRPEGGYLDTSRTAGLVLDYFHQPPDNTPLSALDPTARQVWEEKSQAQITFDEMSISSDHLGTVIPGDTVPATLRSGWFRLPDAAPMRVGQVALDLETERLVLS